MSILIKGMDMPGSCIECPLFAGNGCKALRTIFHEITNVAVRVKDCPLVEVPTPHGRIVDIDAVLDGISNADHGLTCGELIKQTTIIEAED